MKREINSSTMGNGKEKAEETEQNRLLEMGQMDNSILPPRFLPWASAQIGVPVQ